MEIQLQELLDKIKKDGIEEASALAAKLKSEAEAEASRIIAAAQKKAEGIIEMGKTAAERSQKAGIDAIGQAARNLILAFKGEIQAILDKIIEQAAGSAYAEDTIKSALPEILKAWVTKNGADSLDVLVPEDKLTKLKEWFDGKLAGELKKGVEIKPVRNLDAGFRIAEKDGSAYYDFSAEAVAQLFAAYLNPKLAEILKNQCKGM